MNRVNSQIWLENYLDLSISNRDKAYQDQEIILGLINYVRNDTNKSFKINHKDIFLLLFK